MDPDQALEQELGGLHLALLEGEPTASARLAAKLVPALSKRLAKQKALLFDRHEAESCIGLTIAKYLNDPGRYDPAKGPLLRYLLMDASGDLITAYNVQEKNRSRLTLATDDVVLERFGQNYSLDDQIDQEDDTALAHVIASLNEQERQFTELWKQGVRETAPFAEILGLGALPVENQRQGVKIFKDALKKKIKRRYLQVSSGLIN